MAVRVFCDSPKSLLESIKRAIREGSVETWALDIDGDLTHSPEQWKDKAWFRPVIEDDQIRFNILGQKNVAMSKTIYGVYHGRFIEMLLAHFDTQFSRATATALPISGDRVRGGS
jgi:hypothetical protein